MKKSLKKIAFVTGASGDIGLAISKELISHGTKSNFTIKQRQQKI